MQSRLLATVLIATIALCATSCAASRKCRVESLEFKAVESSKVQEFKSSRDSVVEKVMVVVYDTVREVTTITINTNEEGDTTFRSVVTDRVEVRDREFRVESLELRVVDSSKVQEFKSSIDSVLIQTEEVVPAKKRSNIVTVLKWLFAVIVSLGVLIVVIRAVSR